MKICEMCEFGNCVWPDCELSTPLEDHSDKEPSAIMIAWAGMIAFSLAIFSLIAWMVI